MNTRNSILCKKCQHSLSDASEMMKKGFLNLGLRTAGDGEIVNATKSSLHSDRLQQTMPTGCGVVSSESFLNLKSLREEALKDHQFLDEESQYLQSLAS